MTVWLSNLLAYSVQLGVLVGAAILLTTLLRVHAPRTALRFWQIVFAAAIVWPIYQVLALTDAAPLPVASVAVATSPPRGWHSVASIAAMDSRVAWGILTALASGTVLRLAWIGMGLIKLRRLCNESESADAMMPLAAKVQREIGVTADIRLSDAISSPVTVGAQRSTVLLPRDLCRLPAPLQRAVLVHELLHVQRGDWTATLVEELWCAVLWFHPAARALASRLTFARETLVDAATIARTHDRSAYAAALLEFSTSPSRLATGMIGRRRQLERRIDLLAREVHMTRSALALKSTVAASLVIAATVMTTSAFPLAAAPQSRPKVYRPSEDKSVALPQPVGKVKAVYTPKAIQARIEGTVWLLALVLPNGDVGDVSVKKSLDKEYGLDDEAVKAMRQWTFKPGTKDGKPVAVEVTVEMTFTLK